MRVPVSATLYESLLAQERARPGATAIRFEARRISYGEFRQAVDGAAEVLSESGIRHGMPFAVYSQSRPEVLAAYYAASRLGAVFVPINPNMTAAEVAHVVRHCEAPVMFHDEVVAEAAAKAMPGGTLRPIRDLIRHSASSAGGPDPRIRAEDDFLIIYTSGSTGTPKAVVFDHRAQMSGLASLSKLWAVGPQDITLVALPLGYLYGLSTACGTGLLTGGEVVVQRRFHPGELLETFIASKATIFHGVPTMFTMMLEFSEQNGLRYDLSGVRSLICAGAPLSEELRQRFADRFGKDIQDYYALTESTPVFGKYASESEAVPRGSLGKCAPGVEPRIVDARGQECAVGEQGELLVRAPLMIKRYHKDPELTESSMVNGYFKTGDIAYRDERGYYYLTGRIKDIIIRGGANIAPAEVEAVLSRHPAIQDVAVIGVPDKIFGEVPIAFVLRRPGTDVSAEALIAHAGAVLADFKVPRHYVFEERLPLGITGKVDKKALKARWKDLNR